MVSLQLPPEIWAKILGYLDESSLLVAISINLQWKLISEFDPTLRHKVEIALSKEEGEHHLWLPRGKIPKFFGYNEKKDITYIISGKLLGQNLHSSDDIKFEINDTNIPIRYARSLCLTKNKGKSKRFHRNSNGKQQRR